MKNSTQKSIAVLVAFMLSILLSLLLFLLKSIFKIEIDFLLIIVMGVITFIATYFMVYITVEEFIYRKVKIIYKIISDLKAERDKGDLKDYIEKPNILDEVQAQVIEFSSRKSAEIEELKKMEKYRREFLGNVSHELKTPIFNIQGYLETLLDGGLEDERISRDYVKRAADNADRLSNIVEDLLLISQYESGELELEMERFDIHKLTKEIFYSLEMHAKTRSIDLQFKEECNRSFYVEADRARIQQVLFNLITNAIKYGRNGGYVSVGFYVMEDNLLTEVSDNGPGIEHQHLNRLFERFYRIDKARSREKGGTGLGLSIVKHIIEAHKQIINVRSKVGVGTTFGFTLKKAN
jgi:two-component system phosphate regulon sensor histidine kinase PhoR